MRIAFALICSLVLASLAGLAEAADYHGRGYVGYSNGCRYQKVVRYQRTVRYAPVGGYAPSYVTPHRVGHARPCFYGLPTGRYRLVRFSEFNYSGVIAYAGHDCYWRKAPLGDGWVWGVTKICY